MSKCYQVTILILFICLFSACSSRPEQNSSGQSSPYIKLSTPSKENPNPVMPDEQVDEHHGSSPNQVQNQDAPEQKLPEDYAAEDRLQTQEIQETEDPKSGAETVSTELPFQDFKARWNAVTDEQMSNLYIKDLEEVSSNGETFYRSNLSNQLELRVFVHQDHIQQLELISKDNTKVTVAAMLTGWSQIITLLHPNIEIYDVDELFNKMGVEPNGNLTKVKQTSFTYNDLHYEVTPTENGYSFIGRYDKP